MKLLRNIILIAIGFGLGIVGTVFAQIPNVDNNVDIINIPLNINSETPIIAVEEFISAAHYEIWRTITANQSPAVFIDETAKKAELERYDKLAQADQLYLSGDKVMAAIIYQKVKQPFALEQEWEGNKIPEAIYDPDNLPPKGAVYWRIYQEGIEQGLESKILAPLELLVQEYPEYIEGHIQYAEALKTFEREDQVLKVLQAAVLLYPNEPHLVQAKIEAEAKAELWLQASLSARRFALFNSDHFLAQDFNQLADEYLQKYQNQLQSNLTLNTIGNIITGAVGYVVTGNLYAPLSALEATTMVIQGESAIGESAAKQLQEQLPMVEDEEILSYVRDIGNKLAEVAGRDEFNYQFYVINDERLNAFALPGGKIFVNLGAIVETKSEAELAGLLAHELAHAVLSHGFQLVAQSTLTSNVSIFVPYGGMAANLLVLNYSREMETEADVFGTRVLVATDYAADGLHNLMIILEQQDAPEVPAWLSTHPDTTDRVGYLEEIIVINGFNRYAYEGVVKHNQIKEIAKAILEEVREERE